MKIHYILILTLFMVSMLNAMPIPSKGHTIEMRPIQGAELTEEEIIWKYIIPIVLSVLLFKSMMEDRTDG